MIQDTIDRTKFPPRPTDRDEVLYQHPITGQWENFKEMETRIRKVAECIRPWNPPCRKWNC